MCAYRNKGIAKVLQERRYKSFVDVCGAYMYVKSKQGAKQYNKKNHIEDILNIVYMKENVKCWMDTYR